MRPRQILLSFAGVYVVLVGSLVFRATPVAASSMVYEIGEASQQPAVADLPEGKGRELALKQCSACHASKVWTSKHHSRDEWSAVIDNMISKGMHASDDDLDTITDYLATNFGPVATPAPAAPASPPPPSR